MCRRINCWSFEEAVKVYKSIYKNLKKAKIKNGPTSAFSFTGELEEPMESVRFTVSPLKLNTVDDAYKYFLCGSGDHRQLRWLGSAFKFA